MKILLILIEYNLIFQTIVEEICGEISPQNTINMAIKKAHQKAYGVLRLRVQRETVGAIVWSIALRGPLLKRRSIPTIHVPSVN